MFKNKDAQEKEITKVICAILNGFHFEVPNCFETSDEVVMISDDIKEKQ